MLDRRILRTRRYRLERIEDAFMREAGLGHRLLVLQLAGEKLMTLGDLEASPDGRGACLSQIRALLFARFAEAAADRPATFLSARVLVHVPRLGSRATDLFDARGDCLGSLIEVNDDSRAHPYGWRVELRDLEDRCVVFGTVVDADRSGSFAIRAGYDGREIGDVGPRRRATGRWFFTSPERPATRCVLSPCSLNS